MRSSLNRDTAIILANSIIHSRLNYCNSLFCGLPEISIIKLQRVQNSLARVVCKASRSQSHSSDLLRSLHWLPVAQRIKYKIAVLTYKTIHFNKPSYLADLIKPYHPTRSLRSSFAGLLAVPDVRSALARRSFSFSAPTVWNSLSSDLRSCPSISSFCGKPKAHFSPHRF